MQSESSTVKQSLNLQDQTAGDNEQTILNCLRIFTTINSDLYQFENSLYQRTNHLPRQLFKQFRMIRQDLEKVFNALENYTSPSQDFIEEKDIILQEQIKNMEQQIKNQEFKRTSQSQPVRKRFSSDPGLKETRKNPEEVDFKKGDLQSKRMEAVHKQIQSLKNQLRKNDSQYEIEIKKYNMKYQQMQEEIDYYKQEMDKINQYIAIMDKLQIQIRVLKEVKERDEQLIQNMAKKLRNYERQKNGRGVFLSPKLPSQQQFLSPSRVQSIVSPKSRVSSRYE